jgi:23S rRNA pseudouridine955/2504/2580 synthase
MPDLMARVMTTAPSMQVRLVQVTSDHEGPRLDNFLIRQCKGVPKSHLYKAVRAGQVRVNRGRCAVDYRLKIGDVVRIPPLRLPAATVSKAVPRVFDVVYQDDAILVIDKPAGVAVHGGSGISQGVIESLRAAHPEWPFLELVHRLDRDTSGLLLLAKRRQALVRLHAMMRDGQVDKHYIALAQGRLANDRQHVRAPLTKWLTASGERRVRVDPDGQYAHTLVTVLERFASHTLVQARLHTGRTHQIRVHMAWLGHPILGDTKYGDDSLQQTWRTIGVKRLFLHAHQLSFEHPVSRQAMAFCAPWPKPFDQMIAALKQAPSPKESN